MLLQHNSHLLTRLVLMHLLLLLLLLLWVRLATGSSLSRRYNVRSSQLRLAILPNQLQSCHWPRLVLNPRSRRPGMLLLMRRHSNVAGRSLLSRMVALRGLTVRWKSDNVSLLLLLLSRMVALRGSHHHVPGLLAGMLRWVWLHWLSLLLDNHSLLLLRMTPLLLLLLDMLLLLRGMAMMLLLVHVLVMGQRCSVIYIIYYCIH